MKILQHLLFPPLCLSCKERSLTLFCSGCAPYFELIDPSSRCPYCFAENEQTAPCPECVTKKRWHLRIASALDYAGPVHTLVRKLKYGRMPYLAKTAAAFMLLQYERLGWELPDLIVPVPRRHWFLGENHATLLATAFARPLALPVRPLVRRSLSSYAQARLTPQQREHLSESGFYLKKERLLEDKVILLIDDVVTTGTTLRHTAEALKEGFPKKLYALTLARAL